MRVFVTVLRKYGSLDWWSLPSNPALLSEHKLSSNSSAIILSILLFTPGLTPLITSLGQVTMLNVHIQVTVTPHLIT